MRLGGKADGCDGARSAKEERRGTLGDPTFGRGGFAYAHAVSRDGGDSEYPATFESLDRAREGPAPRGDRRTRHGRRTAASGRLRSGLGASLGGAARDRRS